jgi:DNA-binding NarL/FixJ family response regulator
MRIVIAEDDTLLREGLALLLRSEGFEVVAAVDNAVDFLARLDEADAAVVDVRMPPTFTSEGLKAAAEARARRPGFPVLVLSAYVEDRYAGELLAAGPTDSAICSKNASAKSRPSSMPCTEWRPAAR